jgi:hypothetical protein
MKLIYVKEVLVFILSFLYIVFNDKLARADWVIQTVDPQDGQYSSLAFNTEGNPRISYFYQAEGNLKYAHFDNGWQIENVDSGACSGTGQRCALDGDCPSGEECIGTVGEFTSLALDAEGNPHISYLGRFYSSHSYDLKYAYYNGSSWQIETVDVDGSVGWYTSLALDSEGKPHISYVDYDTHDLKYIYHNGTSWTVPQVVGSAGNTTSLVIDSSNNPHICYNDYSNYSYYLTCTHYNGSSWDEPEIVDPTYVDYISLAIDGSNHLHVSYWASFPVADLKYAYYDGAGWSVQTVLGGRCSGTGTPCANNDVCPSGETCAGDVGMHSSLALDSNGNPHISYNEYETDTHNYVYHNGSSWVEPQVVKSSLVGYSSIAIDGTGTPHISYRGGSGMQPNLQYASPGVDGDGDGIADDQDNCPAIPNGPNEGVCYTWADMLPCTTDTDCGGSEGSCSMNQEDTYPPPDGNGIGNACDCEGNFDCDEDCDGADAAVFKTDFGRSPFLRPCNEDPLCKGNFDCDFDVDGTDASMFKNDFGRSPFKNPCPTCVVGEWCIY